MHYLEGYGLETYQIDGHDMEEVCLKAMDREEWKKWTSDVQVAEMTKIPTSSCTCLLMGLLRQAFDARIFASTCPDGS